MFGNRMAVVFGALLAAANIASAQEEDLSNPEATYALKSHQYAPGGPPETYIYKSTGDRNSSDRFRNTFGKFVIGPDKDDGKATFWWKGKGPASDPNNQHSDKLTYVGRVQVKDPRNDTEAEVDGWLYEATDSTGNKWWLVFGEDKLRNRPYYPVYYSFSKPTDDKFKRWLTYSGTSRL